MYMSEKEQFKVLFGHDQPKKKVVSSFDESQSKTIVRTCTYVSAGSNTYFSLTYFEFRTVSYGPSFFSSDLNPSWKKRGYVHNIRYEPRKWDKQDIYDFSEFK